MSRKLDPGRIESVRMAVEECWKKNGNSPTLREIGNLTGIHSTGMVSLYLDELEKAGKITMSAHQARSILLVRSETTEPSPAPQNTIRLKPLERGRQIVAVPDYGPIAAGIPLHLPEASFASVKNPGKDPRIVTVDIPESYLPEGVNMQDVFALHVQGDSMRDAMLTDGDIVILQRTANIKNRDIVAAWINDDHETTLKRVEIAERGIWLRPENPAFEAHFYLPGQVDIQGKLLAVLRFRS